MSQCQREQSTQAYPAVLRILSPPTAHTTNQAGNKGLLIAAELEHAEVNTATDRVGNDVYLILLERHAVA
jgi:hypothetical protein